MSPATQALIDYVRAANYLSVAQIYLQDNFLLDRDLLPEDIKPRLLGHWGTCPGINFVYAHLNHLIKKHSTEIMFVLGPGHGFPALQANLFMEGSLSKYYPDIQQNGEGLARISRDFSWPYGFPSHSNPSAPGVILEGGELGYSLSTSYGAILDNPELIVCPIIGDGEAETGPIAGAWHINKLIDPATNGAVLPILHVNGYKISGPTVFGRLSNAELRQLFYGYGYEPYIVEGDQIYEKMEATLELAYQSIQTLQVAARRGRIIRHPRFPMIILKTPKGWTGVHEADGVLIEGNYASHQVPLPKAKTDPEHLRLLNDWMHSYNFHEVFDRNLGFSENIKSLVPEGRLKMGDNKHTMGGPEVYKDLVLPNPKEFEEPAEIPGTKGSESMRCVGYYLNRVFQLNEENKNFRLMSPDETYSNKLDPVFESTKRAFVWPLEEWDEDISRTGRVMEMLSEHNLQGLMQGYVLTGRHAIFASYEAFVQIVTSMADQYAKFLHMARLTEWRGDISSLNYILTSSGWEQEHNGFSHQNPGFIDDMLQRQGCFVNVYFPSDANTLLAVVDQCLKTKNEINIIASGKKLQTNWQTVEQAQEQIKKGLSIWDFASDDNPDMVITSIGDYLTVEALAGLDIVKTEFPDARLRFVNVLSLSALGVGDTDCRIPFSDFDDYFTADKPVLFNFHGYPQTLKQVLFDYGPDNSRFSVHGYMESGSTTTPFDMLVRNQTSRYHVAIETISTLASRDVIPHDKADQVVEKYNQKLHEHREHIMKFGTDPDEIGAWSWKR